MNAMDPAILSHILAHLPNLLIRDFLLDIFTRTKKAQATLNGDNQATVTGGGYLYTGKFLDVGGDLYVINDTLDGIILNKNEPVGVQSLNVKTPAQISERNTPITLDPGALANLTGSVSIDTTMGRMLLNYVILVDPFKDLIPYINDTWNIGKIESNYLIDGLQSDKISVDDMKQYSRNLHWLGHFTELAVPNFTQKALTVSPAIIQRRDELLRENREAIAAGDIVVMSKIETELVDMDKAYMKGDPSTLFYDQSVSKSYGIHRKSMFLLGGMVQEFGDKGYSFIENSLQEGWDPNNFHTLCNEIRRGSYNRAKETAKGGEETKFLIRVFQNTQVAEQDCGSTIYHSVNLTSAVANKYIFRNILVNGELLTLTSENIKDFVGRTVQMRSPQHCHTKEGYCFTCMGEWFRTIDQEILTMASISISRSFLVSSLKSMHGQQTKRLEIKSLNQFAF